jgi:hypothetical protein
MWVPLDDSPGGLRRTNARSFLEVISKPHPTQNLCVADLLKMLTYSHVCCAFSSAHALIFGAI